MTQRTSLVGGVISFTAVILLSSLIKEMLDGGGFFQQMLVPVIEDSIDALEDTDTLGPSPGGYNAYLNEVVGRVLENLEPSPDPVRN
jgi:hypothetical protein